MRDERWGMGDDPVLLRNFLNFRYDKMLKFSFIFSVLFLLIFGINSKEIMAIDFDLGGSVGGLDFGLSGSDKNKKQSMLNGGGINTGLVQSQQIWDGTVSHSVDAGKIIVGWTNFVLPFIAALAVLAFVVAGYYYIIDTGNGMMKDKGNKIITWTMVGMTVVLLAYSIVKLLIDYFNSDAMRLTF